MNTETKLHMQENMKETTYFHVQNPKRNFARVVELLLIDAALFSSDPLERCLQHVDKVHSSVTHW